MKFAQALSTLPPLVEVPAPILLPGLVYRSAALHQLAEQVHRIKDNPGTVLITGESGTGKELVARALHTLSQRAAQPFIAFNCSALPPNLVEAELFGYRKGAFTDAEQGALGVIRAAAGGTLLLDEIAELPLEIQPKLLRFLDRYEVHPLGETRPQTVNVRLIVATNADLRERVQAGAFRQDLFHRLNVFTLYLPPLRERRLDIAPLLDHFLYLYSQQVDKPPFRLTREAQSILLRYDYPGNVRELSSIVQRLVAYSPNQLRVNHGNLLRCCPELSREMIATDQVFALTALLHDHFPANVPLAEIRTAWGEAFERKLVAEGMWRHNGNLSRAARDLGWERSTLRSKLKNYGL